MKTVAVTGGIGSGKSTVCAILSSMGVPVYDSDSRARALYDEQPALVSRILDEFAALGVHDSLWDECGELDRKKLAGLVFSSPRLLSALEGIVHPAVREDFLSWKESIGEKEWTGPGDVPFVVIESAIITEKPLFRDIVDKVVEVRASRAARLDRVRKRDGAPVKEIEKRMSAQAENASAPDAVIINDSSLDELFPAVSGVFSSLWQQPPFCSEPFQNRL